MESSASARKPVQGRSRDRVEKVIQTAEQLLMELGPERTSIPEIAQRSGVPRASIYQFFPTKYALFLALSDRHLKQVSRLVGKLGKQLENQANERPDGRQLEEMVHLATRGTADYYNAHPVASMLILGGPMSREAYLSQEVTIHDIGCQLRPLFKRFSSGIEVPEEPDVITIAAEIAFACMKHSYFAHARIVDSMVEQAAIAATAYLRHWLGGRE